MSHLVGNPEDRFSHDAALIIIIIESISGPEVIKLFSISAQLSMKFQLLINVEIIKISGKFRFKTRKLVIYPAGSVIQLVKVLSHLFGGEESHFPYPKTGGESDFPYLQTVGESDLSYLQTGYNDCNIKILTSCLRTEAKVKSIK